MSGLQLYAGVSNFYSKCPVFSIGPKLKIKISRFEEIDDCNRIFIK
jgi:hypothetical protein